MAVSLELPAQHTVVTLATGQGNPGNIIPGVDASNAEQSRLYWVDYRSGGVFSIDKAGGGITTVAGAAPSAGNAGDLTQDPTYIYFIRSELVNWSVNRVAKGGGTITSLASAGGLGLTIHYDSSTVYYLSAPVPPTLDNFISSVPSNGGTRTNIVAQSLQDPVYMSVDHGYVYWVDRSRRTIWRLPLSGGSTPFAIVSGLSGQPAALATPVTGAEAGSIFWSEGSTSNGSLKRRTSDGRIVTLIDGGMSYPQFRNFAVNGGFAFAERSGQIVSVSQDGGPINVLVSVASAGTPIGIAVDSHFIYWTAADGSIHRTTRESTGGGGTVTAPTISVQPSNQTVTSGGQATFTVTVSGTSPTFQWQQLAAGASTWANLSDGVTYSGSTTATLTIRSVASSLNGTRYRVVVTNTNGSATSGIVTLTVTTSTSGGQVSGVVMGESGSNFVVFANGKWSASGDPAMVDDMQSIASAGSAIKLVALGATSTNWAIVFGTNGWAARGDSQMYDALRSINSNGNSINTVSLGGSTTEWAITYGTGGYSVRVSDSTLLSALSQISAGGFATSDIVLTDSSTTWFVRYGGSGWRARGPTRFIDDLNAISNAGQSVNSVVFSRDGQQWIIFYGNGGYRSYTSSAMSSQLSSINNAGYTVTGAAMGSADDSFVVLYGNGGYYVHGPQVLLDALSRLSTVAPAITGQPSPVTASIGQSAVFSVTATGSPAPSYQWQKNGVNITGATNANYTINSVQASDAGSYSVVASNSAGTVVSNAVTLAVSQPMTSRLTNLSIRSGASTGSQALIVGFSIGGSDSKQLLVRGIGPTLGQFGVTGALTDPVLELYDSSRTRLQQNSGWGGSSTLSAAFSSVGAFGLQSNSKDSAISTSLRSGGYTAHVTSASSSSGIALVELYDLDTLSSSARLTNVSARTQVGTGGGILIAGFSITGTSAKQVLIRAIGPTLSTFAVSGTLADPRLAVFDSASNQVQSNDDWGGSSTLNNAFASVGAFALASSSKDSALIATLQPGSYTAQVSGVNNATGVALIEIYELP